MNFRRVFSKLLVCTMMTIFVLSFASALPEEEPPGPYVDSHWFRILESPGAQLFALLTHDVDAGPVPRPEDIKELLDHGFTILNTPMKRFGQSLLLENNRVWPFGTENGGPQDPDYWMTVNFRMAIHRLINDDEVVDLIYTDPVTGVSLKSKAEWWLPPGQAEWINPAASLPAWDPCDAASLLDAAGFVQGTTLNLDYDPDFPCSAQYMRIDPRTGEDLTFEYYAIGPDKAPLDYAMAELISGWLKKAGIGHELVAGTWLGMVIRLINPVIADYELMSGVDLFWGTTAPDILYDLTYSMNRPLWNLAAVNVSAIDTACDAMMSSLNPADTLTAAYGIQTQLSNYEPYLPLVIDNGFTTFAGEEDPLIPGYEGPGYIGIVNQAGSGALGYSSNIGLLSPRGQVWSSNMWARLLGRSGRVDPVTGEDINIWILPKDPTSLNPTTASGEPDWQVLGSVLDTLIQRNPYTLEYWPWAIEEMPQIEEWTGPNGETGMTMEFTIRHYEPPPPPEVRSPSDYENSFQWGACKQAYSSNNKYAKATKEGAHVTYKSYGFEAVTNYIPTRVEVGVEGLGDGDDYLEVQVSWDGGANWTSTVSYTPPTIDPNTPTYLDVTDGREWTWDELNATNFRVKITKETIGGRKDLKVDWLPVRVTRTHPGRVNDIYWHDSDPGPDQIFGTPDDGVVYQVTASDCVFALNLLRFQNNDRYRSVWEPIHDVEQLDTNRFRVYYLRRFPFAFEGISDVALLTPRHIWEDWIDGPDDELWTEDDQNHEDWFGWGEYYMPDPTDPTRDLSYLIGCGPFKYHLGGWSYSVSVHIEANRQYFAGPVEVADVNLDGIVDDDDYERIVDARDHNPGGWGGGMPYDPMWDPACDIAYPAQIVTPAEISLWYMSRGNRWGPRYPPFS